MITGVFQSLATDHCRPLKTAAVLQWVGYLVLALATSALALFSLFLYVLTRRRSRERARQMELQKTWAVGLPPRSYPGPPRGRGAGGPRQPRGGWGSEEDAGVPAGSGTPSAPPLSMLVRLQGETNENEKQACISSQSVCLLSSSFLNRPLTVFSSR